MMHRAEPVAVHRGRLARLLVLLLLLQGLVGSFVRLPVAAAEGLAVCTGEGIVRLAANEEGAPATADRPSCLLCLVPPALGAVEPVAPPLPRGWSLECEPVARHDLVGTILEQSFRARAPPHG